MNGLALQLCALALSFILVALLVVTSSRAAFNAQTENSPNQVSAGAIDLTDNDAGTAMFANVTGLVPGATPVDRCIDVTYTGTVDPGAVLLYATSAPTGGLAPYLNLTVDIGADTTDAFRSCTNFSSTATLYTGTLAGFATAHSSYGAGLNTWDPVANPETRTFRFRVSVQDDQAAEGQTSTFGFTWETRTS
ncbi:hypothetical protein IN07_05015 [Modestobacter caceresii]|uniref:Uncharacterized protein n=1 Tax=Modestobacter caceresii TaxID=1522368 RepID=A0A098YAX8_9ACTN|nr:hypothetical protein IN07_05015 [Modestobacter caceresii]